MIALVAGATGLVGGRLVRLLARDVAYDEVIALARRPLPAGLRLEGVREVVIDWDHLEARGGDLAADHVFCALGTTMRAAGSRERFRRVDLDYPRALARATRRAGARHFSLVSAVGADPGSRVFYNRVKGEAEAAVREAGFPSGAILRPSVLGGRRDERRPLEWIGQRLAALIPGRYRLVDAGAVARAMVALAAGEPPGWRVVESEEIRAMAAAPGGSDRAGPPDPTGRAGSAPALALLVALGAGGCGARAPAPEGLPPAGAVPVEPGRRCHYVDEPADLPALARMVPAAARTGLDLWGEGGDRSDTLQVSVRYGPGGGLEWVRVIGDAPAGAGAERASELERILTRALPPEARPEWGVRLAVAEDGTPVAVLPAVVCPPEPLAGMRTAAPVPTPPERAEIRRAGGRRAEVRVLVDDRGLVVDAEIARTSGSRLVDAHALAAARSTTFRPALHDGFPVAGLATLSFAMDGR